MFKDNPNITKVTDKIFIYKNFLDKDSVNEINSIMSNFSKSDIFDDNQWNDWWKDRNSPQIPELYKTWDKIGEFIGPEYVIHPQLHMSVMTTGDEMYVHSDSPGEDMEENLIAPDMWNTCCIISHGLIVYFGDWEGGEVYYPHIDKHGITHSGMDTLAEEDQLTIKVEPGDLIIHGAHSDCSHGVKKVNSGIRYAYSNFMMKIEKKPDTFPAHGTKENEERWKSGVDEWCRPIGFDWTPPEQVIKEKEQGITGIVYRK